MKDRALITAVIISGVRHELVAPIEVHDGDRFRFQMNDGSPHVTVDRVTMSPEFKMTIGAVQK